MMRERQLGTVPGPPMAILFFVIAGRARLHPDRRRRGASGDRHHRAGRAGAARPPAVRRPVRRQSQRRPRCCSCSATTPARSKTPGLRWANPLYTKKRISLRVRNFESAQLKVNDHDGNPIEIAAVVVWRVVDTAEAVFEVDDYENFVKVQTESAVRNLATSYPTTRTTTAQMSLRGQHRRSRRAPEEGDPGAAGHGRRRGDRGAHQPPRLRAGDRPGDAAAAAGRRDHRRASAHRRRRGRHGRDGARDAVEARASSSSTTSARRRW